jgi:hypothetical protein
VGPAGSETLTCETAGALLAGAQPGANQDALDWVFSEPDLFSAPGPFNDLF